MITTDLASVILNKLNNIMIKVEGGGGGSKAPRGSQEFKTNGTFIVPENVYQIYITACGGGGGGAQGSGYYPNTTYSGGGGGGGGLIYREPYTVTPGESIPITIGTGGVANFNTDSPQAGSAGGVTIIGTLISLPGGQGGSAANGGDAGNTWAGGGLGGQHDGYSTSAGSIGRGYRDTGYSKAPNGWPTGANGGGYGGSSLGSGASGLGNSASANSGGGGAGGQSGQYRYAGYKGGNGGSGYCLIEW